MEEKKEPKRLKKYLTPKELQAEVVSWSVDTLKRRIKEDGFPAIHDAAGGLLIPVAEMETWFKKRPKVS